VSAPTGHIKTIGPLAQAERDNPSRPHARANHLMEKRSLPSNTSHEHGKHMPPTLTNLLV
jgi:hypothetical protein